MVNHLAPYSMRDLLGMLEQAPDDQRVLAEIEHRNAAREEAEARCRTSPALQAALDRMADELRPLAAKLRREAGDAQLNRLRLQFCRLPYPHPDRDKLIRAMQARKDVLAAEAGVGLLASGRAA